MTPVRGWNVELAYTDLVAPLAHQNSTTLRDECVVKNKEKRSDEIRVRNVPFSLTQEESCLKIKIAIPITPLNHGALITYGIIVTSKVMKDVWQSG
jgi:hypothetical protein